MSANDLLKFFDLSTRPKRRRATSFVISILEHIRISEEAYLERVPINLQNSDLYAKAENSVDSIYYAISGLMDAY